MKVYRFPFLLAATAESVRVLRGGPSSKFTMHEYLFEDGVLTDDDTNNNNNKDGIKGRKLDSEHQPIGYRKYELKEVIEVEGRQGISTNGTHYFNSGSTALYTYDLEGNLTAMNENPFDDVEKSVNHLGDIGYYNGEIYTGLEWFEDGRGYNIQIVLYDSETLDVTRTFPWNADSGQVECSAVTVDTDHGLVWMTDWSNGNYIYSYNVIDGSYNGKLHLRATPEMTQGIAFYKGDLYITADDGDADRREHDNLWQIPGGTLLNSATIIRHELEFTVPDSFVDFGEIEGVDFNKDTNEMLVLANRGRQIVLGTPKDLYPGYDREISEIYVFRIMDEDSAAETGGEPSDNTGSETGDETTGIFESTNTTDSGSSDNTDGETNTEASGSTDSETSGEPSKAPSKSPSRAPHESPSKSPSKAPSKAPHESPSKSPSKAPHEAPSKSPSKAPSEQCPGDHMIPGPGFRQCICEDGYYQVSIRGERLCLQNVPLGGGCEDQSKPTCREMIPPRTAKCCPSPPRGDLWDCVLEYGANAGVCPRSTRAKGDEELAFSSLARPVVSLSLSALIVSIGVGAYMVLN